MNEWKELDVGNLPPDIMVGDYELQFIKDDPYKDLWVPLSPTHLKVAKDILNTPYYRYRRRELKPPSHEEIMTKWWEVLDDIWLKVSCYNSESKIYVINVGIPVAGEIGKESDGIGRYFEKEWFTYCKSSIIPPE